jgi:hypothetical protein
MKNRKIHNRIIALAIVALVTGCLQLTNNGIQPARAQLQDGSVKFIGYSIGGIVPGQMVRISVGNLGARRSTSIVFQSRFFDQDGNLVFESARTEAPAGGFGKNDVLHGALGMDFEVGTGRKQFRMEVLIEGRSISASDVLVSAEIVDQGTGITVVILDDTLLSNFNTSGTSGGTP